MSEVGHASTAPAALGTLALATVAAGACGSSTDTTSPPTTGTPATEAPGSVPGSVPPTITPVPSSDAAKRGVIVQTDMGDPWKEFRAARDYGIGAEDCAHDQLMPLTTGSAWTGPTLQRGDAKQYVASWSLVFPTENDAKAYVDRRRSPEYVDCRRAQFSATEAGTGSGIVYATEVAADSAGSGGDEGVLTVYQAKVDRNGTLEPANGKIARYVWRYGNTILMAQRDLVADPSDPPDLDDTVNAEFEKGVNAATARISG